MFTSYIKKKLAKISQGQNQLQLGVGTMPCANPRMVRHTGSKYGEFHQLKIVKSFVNNQIFVVLYWYLFYP